MPRRKESAQYVDGERRRLNLHWVAQEHGVHVKTVRRWLRANPEACIIYDGCQSMSVEYYEAFQGYRNPKDRRREVMAYQIDELGKSYEAAKTWIQRQLARNLTYEQMTTKLMAKYR